MRSGSVPAGWLTVVSVAAVAAVNAAGIWGIAAARRSLREEEGRRFAAETEGRARTVEGALAGARTDLAFLAGSSAITQLGEARAGVAGPPEWSRLATEAALLVFLRGHPEVKHLAVLAGKDRSLVEAGRRGGVPVLWRTTGDATESSAGAEPSPGETRRIRTVVAHDAGSGGPLALRVVAEVDARALLDRGGTTPAGLDCRLRDGAGHELLAARLPGADATARGSAEPPARVSAVGTLRAEGWSSPSPWSLACAQPRGLDASLEPVGARARVALVLNLAVMGLVVLLGFFAVQQGRRRERLEAQAREDERVHELERQLFHAERLSSVGRLAAGLAHELNNPLEGMANYLALVRGHLAGGDLASARQDLDLVREGLDRTAGIVRQVLAQANPAGTEQGPLDLGAVVRQTVEFVRSRPEFRGIDFDLRVPPHPLLVQGSAVMLGQVLLNLLRNACEAQPAGGEVQIQAGREGSGAITIRIADRGPGVAAPEQRRIFDPFYSTKRSTGLGLSVCDAIVRQHQGQIAVQEREGGGAVFAVSLPAPPAAAPTA